MENGNIYRKKPRDCEINVYIELLISFYYFHEVFLLFFHVSFSLFWAFLVIVISLEAKHVLYKKRKCKFQ